MCKKGYSYWNCLRLVTRLRLKLYYLSTCELISTSSNFNRFEIEHYIEWQFQNI